LTLDGINWVTSVIGGEYDCYSRHWTSVTPSMLQLFEKRFKCWGIDIFSHKLLKGFTLTQAVRCPSVYVCSTDPLYLQYKHSSLLRYGMNYDLRGFNSTTIGLIYLQCERSSLFRYGINYDLSMFNSTNIIFFII